VGERGKEPRVWEGERGGGVGGKGGVGKKRGRGVGGRGGEGEGRKEKGGGEGGGRGGGVFFCVGIS